MEPLLDLPIDQFFGALDELGLDPERRSDLLREYRRRNSAFSPVYGLLDSVADEDAAAGMQRADIVPISRPEGMSVFDAIRSGDWRLAVPQGALDAVGGVAGALDVPAAAASGLIPREDMVGEALNAAGVVMGLGGLLARPAGSFGMGGRPRSDFGQDWSTVYHSTRSPDAFEVFDLDRGAGATSRLGAHVGTMAAALDRRKAAPTQFAEGHMLELQADLRRPFVNPATGEPWTEMELQDFVVEQADNLGVDYLDAPTYIRQMLAEEGFTDIPYVNDIEDPGSISNIMLVDRPSDSDAVLRRSDAAFDPARRTDPNLFAANVDPITGAAAVTASQQDDPLANLRAYIAASGGVLPR